MAARGSWSGEVWRNVRYLEQQEPATVVLLLADYSRSSWHARLLPRAVCYSRQGRGRPSACHGGFKCMTRAVADVTGMHRQFAAPSRTKTIRLRELIHIAVYVVYVHVVHETVIRRPISC